MTLPRISTFNDFIGQPRAVNFVRQLIDGGIAEQRPSCPILLVGPSGTGKSALAECIARATGAERDCVKLFAGRDVTPRQVVELHLQLRFFDVLFVDEAHSLSNEVQEILFEAVDIEKVPALTEKGLDRKARVNVAAHWLVMATNQPGRLLKALLTRALPVQFDEYSERELIEIAKRVAKRLGLEIKPQAARRLAQVAQGLPRSIEKRLSTMRLMYRMHEITKPDVDRYLAEEGVDQHGLSPKQREYLREVFAASGYCTRAQLCARLGCDAAYLCDELEDFLVRSHWVDIGPRGRQLSAEGQRIAEIINAEAAKENESLCNQ